MIKSSQINRQQVDWIFQQPMDVQLQILSNHLDICKAVINSLMQADVEKLCGEYYRHDEQNKFTRWGYNPGSVRMGAQRIPVQVPRVRDIEEQKAVPLELYEQLRELPEQKQEVLQSVLHGISMRDYEHISTQLLDSFGLSPSSLSRSFVEASRKAIEQFCTRRFEDHTFVAMFIDGKHLSREQMIIALGITDKGEKILLSVIQSATENSTAVGQMLRGLIERDFKFKEGLLCVIDGSKGIRKALEETWGERALIQRCQWHKRENVVSGLPQALQVIYRRKMQQAYELTDYLQAKDALMQTGEELQKINLGSYHSLLEGLDETLTLHRLGIKEPLGKSFSTTNCIESINSQLVKYTRKVKRWMDSEQRYRWVISGLIEIEHKLFRVNNYQQLHLLSAAIAQHIKSLNPISTKNET
jgi:transposase-like protein